MMLFFAFSLLPCTVSGVTCSPELVCTSDAECVLRSGAGTTCAGLVPSPTGPLPTTFGYCPPFTTTLGTTTAGTTAGGNTNITTVVNSTCFDLLNPLTGVSDCPSRANLCADVTYLAVMQQQCPRTCRFCSTSSSLTGSGTCVDLLNPATGVSDCPSRTYLCQNSVYLTVMQQQCPLTCGFCTGVGTNSTGSITTRTNSTATGSCVDLVNPNTGISDCPARNTYCTNAIYISLMKIQCPATCGFCSGH